MKTRKDAAEDAKLKAAAAENAPPPMTAIEDDEDDSAATTGVANKPADDQVLNDELAAMGIDPSNPDGRKQDGTPEPVVPGTPGVSSHGNLIPAAEANPAPVKRAAAKKPAAKKPSKKKPKKKPVKKK